MRGSTGNARQAGQQDKHTGLREAAQYQQTLCAESLNSTGLDQPVSIVATAADVDHRLDMTSCLHTTSVIASRGADYIVDLEDHFADLSGQEELLLLAYERLKHVLLPHVVGPHIIAVNAQIRILLR